MEENWNDFQSVRLLTTACCAASNYYICLCFRSICFIRIQKNKPNRLTSQNSPLSNYWIYLKANILNLNITPCVDQCINVKRGINHYLEVMNLQWRFNSCFKNAYNFPCPGGQFAAFQSREILSLNPLKHFQYLGKFPSLATV